jgi:O-antigen ligase
MSTDGSREFILTTSFLAWSILLTFPLMTAAAALQANNDVIFFQLLGGAQYLTLAIAFCIPRDLIGRYHFPQYAIICLIYLSIILQLHDDPVQIAVGSSYTLLLIVTIVAVSLLFTLPIDALARCLGATAVVYVAFGLTAVALFGWPEDRHLGPIHPNIVGSVMLCAFIFSQFREGALFVLLRVVSVVLAASVSSRFAMIGCLLALVVFELSYNPISVKVLLFPVIAAFALLFTNQEVSSLLALDDPDRNVSSGFTGRGDDWNSALALIGQNPFGMGFKRPPFDNAGHNGYLKSLLEFGIIGGCLLFTAILTIVARSVLDALNTSSSDPIAKRVAAARAGGLVALAFATFFQPQLFNLGDVHAISFMLLLFRPNRQPTAISVADRRPVQQ